MKHKKDQQTVDWCRSRHAVSQMEKVVLVLKKAIGYRGRFSTKDVQTWTGLSKRASYELIQQLMGSGYLETNSQSSLSLKATDKAKQLFWVAV